MFDVGRNDLINHIGLVGRISHNGLVDFIRIGLVGVIGFGLVSLIRQIGLGDLGITSLAIGFIGLAS
jgi:hypothetical protein